MTEHDHNFLIVSDLHLSEGLRPETGKWSRNEDFFVDQAFFDLLCFYEENRREGRPWKLIIAGDGFDFLQVTSIPAKDRDDLVKNIDAFMKRDLKPSARKVANPQQRFERVIGHLKSEIYKTDTLSEDHEELFNSAVSLLEWAESALSNPTFDLDRVTWDFEQLVNELQILASKSDEWELSDNEKKYGLGTTWRETVWKMDRIAEGHPLFFSSLAWFLSRGNSVVIMKGNHDVDLFWVEVQLRIKELVVDAYVDGRSNNPIWMAYQLNHNLPLDKFRPMVQTGLTFESWVYFEPDTLYLEHGNQYELFDFFENFDDPTLVDNTEYLRLPPGSFFVRYFFNKVEESFPFADNLRPIRRFTAWAFEHRFKEMLSLLWRYKAGLFKFFKELISKSLQDRARKRREDRAIKDMLAGKARPDLAAQLSERSDYQNAVMDHIAKEPLTKAHLELIADLARRMRTHIVEKLIRFALILFPIVLIVLGFLLVFIAPAIWASGISATAAQFARNYFLMSVAMGVLTMVIKSLIAPWLLSKTEGDDYLLKASKEIWKILQNPIGGPDAPTVKYLVFGHTHDPDMVQIGGETKAWYVNTGCWLNRIDEVESWDRLERDFTYLQIIPDEDVAVPGLYRWNPQSGRPEHLRRREEIVDDEKKPKPTID